MIKIYYHLQFNIDEFNNIIIKFILEFYIITLVYEFFKY
jgi:hypothetical protein